jgi:D-3-phosphoglycerate dehydrogenase / 2-oxoglutarate reductase
MPGKCLIIDEMHPSIVPLLQGIGVDADYRPTITREEVLDIVSPYEGIIVRSKMLLDKEFFLKAKSLRYIGRAGAGMDQIDVKVASEHDVILLNAPEGNRDALGEHALGMLLALMNKMLWGDRQVRDMIWDREGNRGFEIKGKTIGLIGYGHMGKSFAKKLAGFDCKVIVYDKYCEDYSDEYATEASMDEIFELTDIFSLHIPLNSETRGLVDKAYLAKFKKNIWFLNTARGEIVVTKDLLQNMHDGKVLGAALDVLENEKLNKLSEEQNLIYNKLFASDRVLLTPHVGGWTYESYEKINKTLVAKIEAMLPEIIKRQSGV